MSIWIIGASGSGKSTLAKMLSERTGLPIFEAGKFTRESCALGAEYEELQNMAIERLKNDHRYFSWRILKETTGKDLIIVGVRNPVDFVDSFDPREDRVLFLTGAVAAQIGFETEGLAAIRAILSFFWVTEIIEGWRVQFITAQKESDDWYASVHCQF